MHILDGKPLEEEIREALGPEVYAELERAMLGDAQGKNDGDSEQDDGDDGKVWFSREKIAKWLAD